MIMIFIVFIVAYLLYTKYLKTYGMYIASRKKFVLICVFGGALLVVFLFDKSERGRQVKVETKGHTNKGEHFDVIVSGYMSGGSSLTGIILGWRKDTFYVYEPLWKLSTWTAWHGLFNVCRTDRLECRSVKPDDHVIDSSFTDSRSCSLNTALRIMRDIYNCKNHKFHKSIYVPTVTDYKGGPSWQPIMDCGGPKHRKMCIKGKLSNLCQRAKHKVTKVLRFTVDSLETLLDERPNLKLIHIFRDPRAIINSRMETDFYNTQLLSTTITNNARALCNKMTHDFREGQRLLKKFPERFKFLYYEDLTQDPFDKVRILYEFLGMDLSHEKMAEIDKIPVFSTAENRTMREKNTAFWWRNELKWDIIHQVQTACENTYVNIGYRSLESPDELTDLNIETVKIPEEYKL